MCVLSAILRIVHPEEYEFSVRLRRRFARQGQVRDRYELLELIQHWTFPFHRFDVQDNPLTHAFRDDRGITGGINFITAFGNFTRGEVSIPTIGLTCDYNPGTVLCIPLWLFRQSYVSEGGDHFAIDHYCCSWTRSQMFREPQLAHSQLHTSALPDRIKSKEWTLHGGNPIPYNYTLSTCLTSR